jgi:hypothetical protein
MCTTSIALAFIMTLKMTRRPTPIYTLDHSSNISWAILHPRAYTHPWHSYLPLEVSTEFSFVILNFLHPMSFWFRCQRNSQAVRKIHSSESPMSGRMKLKCEIKHSGYILEKGGCILTIFQIYFDYYVDIYIILNQLEKSEYV